MLSNTYATGYNQNSTQQKISDIFTNLETVGSSYNTAGNSAATLSVIDAGCRAALQRVMSTKLFAEMEDSLSLDLTHSNPATQYFSQKLNGMGQGTFGQLCAALKGEEISSPDMNHFLKKSIKNDVLQHMIRYGQSVANGSGVPFLTRLEIELGTSERDSVGSITSVQPLWQDSDHLNHIFAQISWHKAPDNRSDSGIKTKYNTYNAGIAYRHLTVDKKYLYGTNLFFDYAPEKDHTRMSVGVDARTTQLAFAANRYMPLSTWRSVTIYNEERAAAGWDVELRGQVPELPSWTAIVKGYQWDGFSEKTKLYGAEAGVEYSPVPAMAMRVGVRDESEGSASLEAALRFSYRFDQPQDLQFKPRTELASVEDYIYEKVRRDNIIRVKQRQKSSAKLTVIQTIGSNTSTEPTGTTSLLVGKTLLMPVTVTIGNTAGAIGRLRFADGSILTAAQNTQVLIEPTLITLISGSMQYVSNGVIHTILVPGGTIDLHGTDIDVVSSGPASSTVRVRDGSVTFTGTSSGSVNLGTEEMGESVNGVVGGLLATNDPTYISHTDEISVKIDRIGNPQNGPKVASYPYERPRIVSETLIPGQMIVFGLRFNDPITVSGGVPRLHLVIQGNNRIANLIGGSGTKDLLFGYTLLAADGGASQILVSSLDKNGAYLMGNGKDAVTTIADTTLVLSGTIGDTIPPSGYAALFTTDPVNNGNQSAASFNITNAEVGTTYTYTITSSGGGTPVSGSGPVTSTTQSVTGLNLSGLADGTLTVSVTLTDAASNAGSSTTDTVLKDTTPPTGYGATLTTTPINSGNKSALGFDITGAEVGSTFAYTLTSSGGGTPVSGSGTIATSTHSLTGINASALADGTYTLSVVLTDIAGNPGVAATTSTGADTTSPSGYGVTTTTSPVNNTNLTAGAFDITTAEVGTTYNYTISSSGGGTNVTGTGTISAVTHSVTNIDLTGLNDGTLTISVTLTDSSGNAGAAVTSTAPKDTTIPSGYGTAFTTTPVNLSNATSAAFDITTAEVGAAYSYTISSSGGGTNVTGTGTISAATHSVTNLDLTGLNDGTLTLSVTLTDASGNIGVAVTNTATDKDTLAPTILSVTTVDGTYEP